MSAKQALKDKLQAMHIEGVVELLITKLKKVLLLSLSEKYV